MLAVALTELALERCQESKEAPRAPIKTGQVGIVISVITDLEIGSESLNGLSGQKARNWWAWTPATAFSFHTPVLPRILFREAVPGARSDIHRLLAALSSGPPSSTYTRTGVKRP